MQCGVLFAFFLSRSSSEEHQKREKNKKKKKQLLVFMGNELRMEIRRKWRWGEPIGFFWATYHIFQVEICLFKVEGQEEFNT